MKKILLALVIISVSIFAQNAGKTGLSFLKFSFGARNAALGDAGTVFSKDVTSSYYNPASLSETSGTEFAFMHNEWIEDTRSEMFGAVTKVFGLQFALNVNLTTVSDIQIRKSATSEPDALFDANYFSTSLSTGFKLTDNISSGLTMRFIHEGLYNEESDGLGFDFGLKYKSPIDGLSFSGLVKNIGFMSELKLEKTKLPGEFRIGGLYCYEMKTSNIGFGLGAEYQNYFVSGDSHINAGLEINYNKIVYIRGGYQTGYESKGLTAGIGLEYGQFKFDYAYIPFEYGLGNASLISLNFKF